MAYSINYSANGQNSNAFSTVGEHAVSCIWLSNTLYSKWFQLMLHYLQRNRSQMIMFEKTGWPVCKMYVGYVLEMALFKVRSGRDILKLYSTWNISIYTNFLLNELIRQVNFQTLSLTKRDWDHISIHGFQ